jgi:hypothetical protein
MEGPRRHRVRPEPTTLALPRAPHVVGVDTPGLRGPVSKKGGPKLVISIAVIAGVVVARGRDLPTSPCRPFARSGDGVRFGYTESGTPRPPAQRRSSVSQATHDGVIGRL